MEELWAVLKLRPEAWKLRKGRSGMHNFLEPQKLQSFKLNNSHPTDLLTTPELRNPSHDVHGLHQFCISPDVEALRESKGLSGRCNLKQKLTIFGMYQRMGAIPMNNCFSLSKLKSHEKSSQNRNNKAEKC